MDDDRMTLRLDGGVVRLTWAPGLAIDRTIARDAMAAVDRLNHDTERPLLVDVAGSGGIDREARGVFSAKCSVSRVALLGSSAVDRMMANFAVFVTRTPVPTRYFTAEDEAREWLLA